MWTNKSIQNRARLSHTRKVVQLFLIVKSASLGLTKFYSNLSFCTLQVVWIKCVLNTLYSTIFSIQSDHFFIEDLQFERLLKLASINGAFGDNFRFGNRRSDIRNGLRGGCRSWFRSWCKSWFKYSNGPLCIDNHFSFLNDGEFHQKMPEKRFCRSWTPVNTLNFIGHLAVCLKAFNDRRPNHR